MTAMVRLQLLFLVTLTMLIAFLAFNPVAHSATNGCGDEGALGVDQPLDTETLWSSHAPETATREQFAQAVELRRQLSKGTFEEVQAARDVLRNMTPETFDVLPTDLQAYVFIRLPKPPEALTNKRVALEKKLDSGVPITQQFEIIRELLSADLSFQVQKGYQDLSTLIAFKPESVPPDLLALAAYIPAFQGKEIDLGVVPGFARMELHSRAFKDPKRDLRMEERVVMAFLMNPENKLAYANAQAELTDLLYTSPRALSRKALIFLSKSDAELVQALAKKFLRERTN